MSWMVLFYYLFVTCLVALFIGIMVKTMIVHDVDVQETHAHLFIENMLQSEHGVSYTDHRVHPGIINVEEFVNTGAMEERLAAGFNYGDTPILAAEIMLFDVQGKTLGTVYYYRDWYERWLVLVDTLLPGKGSATLFAVNKTVLLLDEQGKKTLGIIQFNVVMPNSY